MLIKGLMNLIKKMTELSFLIKIYYDKEIDKTVVEVSELGIVTQGNNLWEAIKNAKEAIEAYFEAFPEEKEYFEEMSKNFIGYSAITIKNG